MVLEVLDRLRRRRRGEAPARLVALVVSGLDVEDAALLDAVHEEFGAEEVPLLSSSNGVPCATFSVDPRADLRVVVPALASRLEGVREGLRVLRVDDPLLAIAGLARLSGVEPSVVEGWVRGGVRGEAPFPLERGYVLLDSGPLRIWLWSEVVDWLRSRGHALPSPEELSAREVRLLDALLAIRREEHSA